MRRFLPLVVALVPLLLAFTWAGKDYAWGSARIIGMFGFSLLMLVVFVLIEKKAAEPIIPLSLFKNSIFIASIIAGFLAMALMYSAVMFIPLFVQEVMGSSATNSGMIITPMLLSQVLAGITTGQIISRTGKYKLLAILSFAIATVGMFLLSRLTVAATNQQLIVAMIVTGVGIGISMPVFSLCVQNAFPRSQIGVSTSGLQFFRNIGGTIGTAVFGSMMTSGMTNGLAKIDLSKLPDQLATVLKDPQSFTNPSVMSTIKAQIPPLLQPVFGSIMEQVKSVLASSISNVFAICIFIAVMGLITVFFLKEKELMNSYE